jgi:hypothetical protein
MIFRWFTKLLTGEAFLLKFGNDSPAPQQQQAAPTTQNVTQTSIPEYAKPYVETLLGKAQATTDISQNPYQQYQGQRIAEFTPMQQQAFQNLGQAAPAGQLDTGTALATATGFGSLGAQDQSQILQRQALGYGRQGSMYGGLGSQIGQQAAGLAGLGIGYGGLGAGYGAQAADMSGMGFGAGQQYAQQATNPYAQQAYMSPYIQNALQPQLQEMQRQYDITGQQEKARATAAGAFGGTRQALAQAENQRNKNIAMNQAIGQGYQNAFQQAQQAQQFGANLGLQGQQLGYQGLGMGIQGAQSGLAGLQAANQLYGTGLQGAQAGMQGAQTGLQGVGQATSAGQYGLAGLGQAGAAASTLGQLGQNQYQQQMGINAAQQQAGAQQQAQNQQYLSQNYQDFLNQQNYPYKQLSFMSDILRGMPLTQQSQSIYQAPPSAANQIMGYGLGAYGLSNLFKGSKEGGTIKAYKKGGVVKNDMGSGLAELALYQVMEGA